MRIFTPRARKQVDSHRSKLEISGKDKKQKLINTMAQSVLRMIEGKFKEIHREDSKTEYTKITTDRILSCL